VQLGKVALLPVQYARSAALAPVRYAKRLAPSAALWPRDELWLVTHRALRQVPRVRAVWEALAAGIQAGAKSKSREPARALERESRTPARRLQSADGPRA
jgi:hypothetical protein